MSKVLDTQTESMVQIPKVEDNTSVMQTHMGLHKHEFAVIIYLIYL